MNKRDLKNNIFYISLLCLLLAWTSAVGSPINLRQKVTIQVESLSMGTVLQMIAQQYNLNIVQSSEVGGEVTLKLEDVALENALEAILYPNGLNYFISGNIIIVKSFETNARGEVITRFVDLDYIDSKTAVNALESILTAKGKAVAIDAGEVQGSSSGTSGSRRISITDTPESVKQAIDIISRLDKKQPQISIEVRMIETNYDDESKIGFKWPTSLSTRLHGVADESAEGDESGSEYFTQHDLTTGNWQWGKLSFTELAAVLDFLELQGNSKLISDPKVTTQNNHPAEIKVTTVIPIQTINRFSEGGAVQDIVTFQDEEVGIQMFVTPHITKSREVILDVELTVAEIIGYSGPADNQKPITSDRTVKTRVTIKNGETAVLGGLLKENKIENIQRIFFLGSLPIIGDLFTHRSVDKSTTDLTIMITPKIVTD